MKKIVSLLLIMVAFVSCESDVTFNNPAFQGQKDNYLWRADVITSSVENGYMTLHAWRGTEEVRFVFPAPSESIVKTAPVKYTFGVDDNITATYEHADDDLVLVYKTGKNVGNGEFVINEYSAETKKLSGSFRFNAIYQGDTAGVPKNLNFQDGFIYGIKL